MVDDKKYMILNDCQNERLYYQYETLNEIERQFTNGNVLSGFTTDIFGNDIILIAYDKKRRSGYMNAVGIQ